MEKSIITVGDANSSGGKVVTGAAAHTSMGKDALQLKPIPPWNAVPKVDQVFLCPQMKAHNDLLLKRDIKMTTKHSTNAAVVFFALFHPLLAVAQQAQQLTTAPHPQWDWPGPWHMWSGGWGFWWIFPLFMLFLVIICIAIFFLGHRSGGGQHWGPWQMMDRGRSSGDPTHSALQILNERFAKGEIQQQEYEQKKVVILSSRQQ